MKAHSTIFVCALVATALAAGSVRAKAYSSASDIRNIEARTVDVAIPESLLTELEQTAHPERAGLNSNQENRNGTSNDGENRRTGQRDFRLLRPTDQH